MFCDGKCEHKGKKCGLLTQLTMQNGSEIKTFDMCIFKAILESQLRMEQGNIRLQAAVENSRNEKSKNDNEIIKTISSGFLGMIYSINENPKTELALKKLGERLENSVKQIEEK